MVCAAGPQLLFPVFASALGFLGVEAARQTNDGAALKDLIQKYTNIIVKDAPDGVPNMPKPADGVYWYVKDPDVYRRVLVQGDLGLGESYMDGLWESNDVEAFIREMIKLEPVKKDLGLLFPGNSPTGAKENIAKHYDISLKLYEQMLGPTCSRLDGSSASLTVDVGSLCRCAEGTRARTTTSPA